MIMQMINWYYLIYVQDDVSCWVMILLQAYLICSVSEWHYHSHNIYLRYRNLYNSLQYWFNFMPGKFWVFESSDHFSGTNVYIPCIYLHQKYRHTLQFITKSVVTSNNLSCDISYTLGQTGGNIAFFWDSRLKLLAYFLHIPKKVFVNFLVIWSCVVTKLGEINKSKLLSYVLHNKNLDHFLLLCYHVAYINLYHISFKNKALFCLYFAAKN